jgi:carbonic anhydrase/acetyltransferase-like protein (isoleucine patch superfamily)
VLRSYKDQHPRLGARVFVDPSAQVIGDVELGDDVSIWMGTVLRGDINFIRIGARSNIQENSVVHVDYGDFPVVIEEGVTVGHAAILHGCHVERDCLIGMGAKLLNGARIGKESLVAAGALVLEGMVIPPRSLVMGAPARMRRAITDEEAARLREAAVHYVSFKDEYLREGEDK